jgi:hypothetical protein
MKTQNNADEALYWSAEYIHHLECERSHLEVQNRLLAKQLVQLQAEIGKLKTYAEEG